MRGRVAVARLPRHAAHGPLLQLRSSKIFPQVQAGVQMRDLFFVTVEHERGLFARKEAGPDDSLASLAPAWMIDVRVHIGVEAVLVRCKLIPKGLWLLGHEVDLRQRFGALESVLPRNNEADRCAVLITKRFAVKTDRDKRQLVHRLRQSEALRVRPWKVVRALRRTIPGIKKRSKLYIFRFGFWLHKIEKFRQRNAVPRDHYRPSLDATVPIITSLDWAEKLNQFVDVDLAWSCA